MLVRSDAPNFAKLSIRDVNKDYHINGANIPALRGVTLDVKPGEFLSLVGPSGCGKSTMLNMIANLDPVTSGDIRIDGRPHTGHGHNLGYILQKDALMPWRTARQNVELGLELKNVAAPERRARSNALLRQVGLGGFEDHFPHQLSGGMRQRINIARTLAVGADILLMDEPFAALDSQTRDRLQNDFLRWWQQKRATVLFVTHDLGEAIALSDRVVVISARPGRIHSIYDIDIERPRDIVETRFSDRFVALYRQLWNDLKHELAHAESAL